MEADDSFEKLIRFSSRRGSSSFSEVFRSLEELLLNYKSLRGIRNFRVESKNLQVNCTARDLLSGEGEADEGTRASTRRGKQKAKE